MTAYYNEIDPAAVEAIRCLMEDGVIAPGVVDDRSIKDVEANDLRGFTQCHFFAGAGTWSLAARHAGWADTDRLWSASCPCQPFSAAGKGLGADDPRHLWPDLYRLIHTARDTGFGPSVLVGEQVAGKAGYAWFDGVCADLAREGIAARVVDFPALAVDAPHERNRLYWCAVDNANPSWGLQSERRKPTQRGWAGDADAFNLCHPLGAGLEGQRGHGDGSSALASANGGGEQRRSIFGPRESDSEDQKRTYGQSGRPNGSYWSDHEWLICHDGKARRAKPGTCLLVNGLAGRIPAWRLAGNGIVLPAAVEVLAALREVLEMSRT